MAIRKLLVANRGEIALRIFRTCGELGIATVAVAAPDDRGSLHARSAGETIEIESVPLLRGAHPRGPSGGRGRDPPRLRLPRGERRLRRGDRGRRPDLGGAAGRGAAPGGDKLEAKQIAVESGVPVVPAGEPSEIGFPLVVKAAAGGGGRGMRVVRQPGELEDALEAARREAKAAFGDDRSSASATSSARATSRSSSSQTPTEPCWLSESATALSSAAIRRCSRSLRRPRSTRSCVRR